MHVMLPQNVLHYLNKYDVYHPLRSLANGWASNSPSDLSSSFFFFKKLVKFKLLFLQQKLHLLSPWNKNVFPYLNAELSTLKRFLLSYMATTTQPLLRGIDGRRHFKDFFGLLERKSWWQIHGKIFKIFTQSNR